ISASLISTATIVLPATQYDSKSYLTPQISYCVYNFINPRFLILTLENHGFIARKFEIVKNTFPLFASTMSEIPSYGSGTLLVRRISFSRRPWCKSRLRRNERCLIELSEGVLGTA